MTRHATDIYFLRVLWDYIITSRFHLNEKKKIIRLHLSLHQWKKKFPKWQRAFDWQWRVGWRRTWYCERKWRKKLIGFEVMPVNYSGKKLGKKSRLGIDLLRLNSDCVSPIASISTYTLMHWIHKTASNKRRAWRVSNSPKKNLLTRAELKFNTKSFKGESTMTMHYCDITNLSGSDRSGEHSLSTHCSTNHW